MKKILVLIIAVAMSGNCKAQIAEIFEIVTAIVSGWKTGSTISGWIFSSPHEDDLIKAMSYYDQEEYVHTIATLSTIDNRDLDVVVVAANYYRGLSYFYLEKYEKAVKEFKKVINFEPSFNTLYKDIIADYKYHAPTIQEIAYVMALKSEHSTDVVRGLGEYDKENYSNAITYFSNVDGSDETLLRVLAHYYKGKCYFKQGHNDSALTNLKQAINIQIPTDAMYTDVTKRYQKRAQQMTYRIK